MLRTSPGRNPATHSHLAPWVFSTTHRALILFWLAIFSQLTAYISKHYICKAAHQPYGIMFSLWLCHFWETLAPEGSSGQCDPPPLFSLGSLHLQSIHVSLSTEGSPLQLQGGLSLSPQPCPLLPRGLSSRLSSHLSCPTLISALGPNSSKHYSTVFLTSSSKYSRRVYKLLLSTVSSSHSFILLSRTLKCVICLLVS